jgi:hypothetical protein
MVPPEHDQYALDLFLFDRAQPTNNSDQVARAPAPTDTSGSYSWTVNSSLTTATFYGFAVLTNSSNKNLAFGQSPDLTVDLRLFTDLPG